MNTNSMKIVLITGRSGAGKTSILKELCNNNDKYNPIYSYTDRPKRNNENLDHIFVTSSEMDTLMDKEIIVASTQIDEYRYCSILSQFHLEKVNLYITDLYGANDVINAFPHADIMTLLIQRDDVDISDYREGRDVVVPVREDVHFLIDNNSTIEAAAKTIDVLVSFDFFHKSSHTLTSIEESLEKVNEQRRYLEYIERSLLTQQWIRDKPLFKQMCKYISTELNDYFDFSINIETFEEPEFDVDTIIYPIYIIIPGERSTWDVEQNVYEQAQKYIYEFCDDYNCKNIAYHIFLNVDYRGLDER